MKFYFPRAALRRIAGEIGYEPVETLAGEIFLCRADDTFRRLAIALEPALVQPQDSHGLFLHNVTRAAAAHFVVLFAQRRAAQACRGGLAPWQQKRAQEMLEAGLDGSISLAEIAARCGLSVRRFSRAFSQSMGMPPHVWLMRRRVETAKLLLNEYKICLANVAERAGFGDQSHMTRIFSRLVGKSPGAWRRSSAPAHLASA